MRVVLIGDIGWRYLYHLGDEAMTEAAIDMLRARGISDITLVAGQPAVSEEFYGLPCVTRAGFWGKWSRERNDRHLAGVSDILASGELPDASIYTAIRDCDAVVIAGGGNMNSIDYHLLYERVASARIAKHFGKPLYVTSQTVGPKLNEADQELLAEIITYARAFGAREATTEAMLRRHFPTANIVRTLDDGVLLAADGEAREAASTLSGDEPYVVASFTHHGGTMWEDADQYHHDIGRLCRDISSELDVNVVLVPHAGSLDASELNRDQEGNIAIEAHANTPRVRATRMVTAREDVALIENAVFSLSTRYHPLIFSAAASVPAIGIAPSYYSIIRMRGAGANVGLERFVIPGSSLDLVMDAATEVVQRKAELSAHLTEVQQAALEFQNAWWDALVTSMKNDEALAFTASLSPHPVHPHGEWSATNERRMAVTKRYALAADKVRSLEGDLEAAHNRHVQVEQQLQRTTESLNRYKQRKAVRILDSLGSLLRR